MNPEDEEQKEEEVAAANKKQPTRQTTAPKKDAGKPDKNAKNDKSAEVLPDTDEIKELETK